MVVEFEHDGSVSVSEDSTREAARSAPAHRLSASTASKQYRDTAYAVGLRHAGGPGPRAAGLAATEFADLFVALIDQESRFDPRAVSSKGAQGLGQLMPDTARLLGVSDPFNPSENLDGAARYFTAQLARFGDVRLALAAYNAGPHRVEEYGGVPPFRETLAYVATITAAVDRAPAGAALTRPAPEAASAARGVSTNPEMQRNGVWDFN
ncbi:transglycosylase, putative [Aurantimonas sp. 22II-16-19i]|nr:transglycosylase, putative [Aurantimonas sp. 22II-16-19i]